MPSPLRPILHPSAHRFRWALLLCALLALPLGATSIHHRYHGLFERHPLLQQSFARSGLTPPPLRFIRLPGQKKVARYWGNRIWIEKPRLEALAPGQQDHVLLHELAHALDDGRGETVRIRRKGPRPGFQRVRHLPSASLAFSQSAGWSRGTERNQNPFRRISAYERHSPIECFAENLATAWADPSYPLRRPVLAAYFSETLGLPIAQDTQPLRIPLLHPPLSLGPEDLLACGLIEITPGTTRQSRFGHSVLGFRIRGKEGPRTLVVEIAAFVPGSLSVRQGLFGGYPVRYFFEEAEDYILQRSWFRDRPLQWHPLRLDARQGFLLLQACVERYWCYQADYSFLKGNCSDEVLWCLQSVLPGTLDRARAYSPQLLLRFLRARGLLAEPERMETGLFAARDTEMLTRAWLELAAEDPGYRLQDAIRSQELLEPLLPMAGSSPRVQAVASGILLLKLRKQWLNTQRVNLVSRAAIHGDLGPAVQARARYLAYGVDKEAAERLQHGYGIPMREEQASVHQKSGIPGDPNAERVRSFLANSPRAQQLLRDEAWVDQKIQELKRLL